MGMAATKHFCGDKLINIQVFENRSEDNCCGDVPMDCCQDEQITVAPLQLEIPLPSTPSVNPIGKTIQSLCLSSISRLSEFSIAKNSYHNTITLRHPSPDLHALLCCFLI